MESANRTTVIDIILLRLPIIFAPGHAKTEMLEDFRRNGIRMGCITPNEIVTLDDEACYRALQERGLSQYFEPRLCMVYVGDAYLDPSGLLLPRLYRCEDIDSLKRILFVGLTPAEIRYAQDLGLTTALFDPQDNYRKCVIPGDTARISSIAAIEELVYAQPTARMDTQRQPSPSLQQQTISP